MNTINCIIKKVCHLSYKVVLVYEDGTRNELPAVMSLNTAASIQRLFRKHLSI